MNFKMETDPNEIILEILLYNNFSIEKCYYCDYHFLNKVKT